MAEKKPDGQPQQQAEPQPPPEPPPAPPPAQGDLGVAAESIDPVVHQLLAEREIAISNGNEDAVQAVNARLAELGVK